MHCLFFDRTQTVPCRTVVVAQRIHIRRPEVQAPSATLVVRSWRPVEAVAVNEANFAVNIVSSTRCRKENQLSGPVGLGVEVPTIARTVPNSIGRIIIRGIASCGCKSRKCIAGRKLEADRAGIVNGFDDLVVICRIRIVVGVP